MTIRVYPLGVVYTERRDGSALVETTDLPALRRHLGDELLVGFLRLFIWADRLQTMSHLGLWNSQELPEDSVAFTRNLQTLVWTVGGSLFEAADAIHQLQRAGIADRLTNTKDWDELLAMADRWEHETRLRRVRNNIGFHVDPAVMRRGLERACRDDERMTVLAGDDATAGRTTLRLGLEVLLMGTGLSLDTYRDIIQVIANDHGRLSDLVQLVFIAALQDAGF